MTCLCFKTLILGLRLRPLHLLHPLLRQSQLRYQSHPLEHPRLRPLHPHLHLSQQTALMWRQVKPLPQVKDSGSYLLPEILRTLRFPLFLIKATKVLPSRAESDFEFVFCCLIINIKHTVAAGI